LKYKRANALERTGPRTAKRTKYVGNPDTITINLDLEVAPRWPAEKTELTEHAKKIVDGSPHKKDLPRVRIDVTFKGKP
jgi:hypothetical protein